MPSPDSSPSVFHYQIFSSTSAYHHQILSWPSVFYHQIFISLSEFHHQILSSPSVFHHKILSSLSVFNHKILNSPSKFLQGGKLLKCKESSRQIFICILALWKVSQQQTDHNKAIQPPYLSDPPPPPQPYEQSCGRLSDVVGPSTVYTDFLDHSGARFRDAHFSVYSICVLRSPNQTPDYRTLGLLWVELYIF